jgi:uncharacterized protein (DUF488 family)
MEPRSTPAGSAGEPGVQPPLYSVGHSNVTLEDLLSLLQRHDIEVVADVRTSPRSRYVPHFDSESLQEALSHRAIRYVPLGQQLGGRPDGDEFYDEQDRVLYGRLARSELFQAGIDRVIKGSKNYRIALLCSEEDPSKCHRHLLIGRVLRDRGITVLHIRSDGRLQTEDNLDTRETATSPQAALFEIDPGERPWRSIRSVSRRKEPLNSSGH